MQDLTTVTLELNPDQAEALAQLVKRIGWTEMRSLAPNDMEALLMDEAVHQLRVALAEAGYAPR